MRRLVMQMMTTLDGRLDDPDAWARGIPDDLYAEIDRVYANFDTILVGRTTYAEMAAYWPSAGDEPGASEAGRSMARKMNSYRKVVLTRGDAAESLGWEGSELASVPDDEAVIGLVAGLKSGDGGDIHLSGGAELAQSLIRLGLVDRYHLLVHPVTAGGKAWFDAISEEARELNLLSATAYSNGVVGLNYEPVGA